MTISFVPTIITKALAYFLLILLLTLSFGLSVFAEQDLDAEELVPVGVSSDEVVVVESGEATASESTDNVSESASMSQQGDNYRREPLPSDEVRGDFVVGPGRFDVRLAPGESVTEEITVANRMGREALFRLVTEDITASENPEGGVVTLGDDMGPYTLRDFISVAHDEFILEHGMRARIPVTISLPPDAEPGGRYGSLITSITTSPGDINGTSGAQPGSVIESRIATLIFVTTPGEINRQSVLNSFNTENNARFIGHSNIRQSDSAVPFVLTVENSGSVHTLPYGVITITNLLGETVATHVIQPFYVMPDSLRSRIISVPVREFMIGRYTATLELNRGYDDIVDTKTVAFYVIPWMIVLLVFLGLFVFFLLVRLFLNTFELKRKS